MEIDNPLSERVRVYKIEYGVYHVLFMSNHLRFDIKAIEWECVCER